MLNVSYISQINKFQNEISYYKQIEIYMRTIKHEIYDKHKRAFAVIVHEQSRKISKCNIP